MNKIKGKTPNSGVNLIGDPEILETKYLEMDDFYKRSVGLRLTDAQKAMQEAKKARVWQKCPICKGAGGIFSYDTTSSNHYTDCVTCGGKGDILMGSHKCPTCKGKRIISTATGKPPE